MNGDRSPHRVINEAAELHRVAWQRYFAAPSRSARPSSVTAFRYHSENLEINWQAHLLRMILDSEISVRRERKEVPTVDDYRDVIECLSEVTDCQQIVEAVVVGIGNSRAADARAISSKDLREGSPLKTKRESYELLEQVGVGGMGTVWKARRASDSRHVAIKVAKPGNSRFSQSIEGEIEKLINLSGQHPNVVAVLDAAADADPPFLVMELVTSGRTLRHLINGSPMAPHDCISIMEQVAKGLSFLHAQPEAVFHRDLKPENVLLTADGVPKITDFGLSVTERNQQQSGMAGSRLYRAPEVLRGRPFYAGADIWAFGVILYELLAGKHPFRRDGIKPVDAENAIQQNAIPRPLLEQRPDLKGLISDGVLTAVDRCLYPNSHAKNRYVSIQHVFDDLATKAGKMLPDAAQDESLRRLEQLSVNIHHGDPAEQIIGRDHLIGQLLDRLRAGLSNLISVYAKAGMGKTALMKRLEWVAKKDPYFQVIFYRFNRPLNDRDLADCLLSLTYQLARVAQQHLPDEYRDYPERERIAYLRRQFASRVNAFSAASSGEGRLLVLVDAMDEMRWDDAYGEITNPLGWFPSIATPNVAAVLSTRDRRFIPVNADKVEILKSDPNHIAAVQEYVDSRTKVAAVADFLGRNDLCASAIIEASDNNFMYLWFVFNDIEHGRHEYLVRGRMPLGLIGYYEQHWSRLWEPPAIMSPEAMKVLLCLVFSGVNYNGWRFPEASFASEDLMRVSGINDRKELQRLLRQWDQFLERRWAGGLRYGFYHSSYLEFLLGQLDESRATDLVAEAMDELGLDPKRTFDEISVSLFDVFVDGVRNGTI